MKSDYISLLHAVHNLYIVNILLVHRIVEQQR